MREKTSTPAALLAAIVAVLAAWGVRLLLGPLIGERIPFVTFFPAIFAIAWWGGFRTTLFATLLSVPVLTYFILQPKYSFAVELPEYRAGLFVYIVVALATGWLGEQLHQARHKAQLAGIRAIAERERLRVTLASIGDGVIVTDERGQIVSLNPVAESLTGWTQSQARDKPLQQVFRIINEETRRPVEDPCAKVLQSGAIAGLANHTVLISKDRTERPIDDSAAPILDASGKVCGAVLVFRDVSEKRRADKALSRSQRELYDFFENAALPMNSVGPDGFILRANQAELDMLGYSREEYVGRHIADFHVDKQVIDNILARLSRGEILHNCEAQLRGKDGSIKDVLITSSGLWEDGKFLHTRCFTRDITDRKRAEEDLAFLAHASRVLAALADRESALQQAARLALPYLADWCVVYVVDDQGAIDYHAHAHCDLQMERALAEMLTHSPLDWDSPTATVRALQTGQSQLMPELPQTFLDDIAQSQSHRDIIRALDPRSVIAVPLRIRDKTIGAIGLVSCDAKRRYTEHEVKLAESFAEHVATAVDNSRLFHAVKEASRQKDEFLAMLAHELRNPLAAIRYAVALGQMTDGDSSSELLDIIDRQTQNLAHLIDDLLDVSRISRDKVTLRKKHTDVRSFIDAALATVQPLIEQKHHELKIDVAGHPLHVLVDPTRAEQIVANLLTNAAKYTRDGGCVAVRAFRDDGDVVIEVADTGIGLPPEMLTRVFDLFAQADRTLDRSEGGLGIGLTVARKLAEMHGGTIAASSEGLGKGSTFTVRLPLSEASPIERHAAPPPLMSADFQRVRILVVDDNRDTATTCAMLLKSLGHDVATSYDGLDALEQARTLRPNVLFLDIGLPGMNGYELARTLRDEGFERETLVAVSGYGQPEDRRRSREAGFDHHLVKPVDQAALVSALQNVHVKEPIAS
jgi:PAS domain S-box-containing protein